MGDMLPTTSQKSASTALWRRNSELHENNQRLEREAASLRDTIERRRLTSSSADSQRSLMGATDVVPRPAPDPAAEQEAVQSLRDQVRALQDQVATARAALQEQAADKRELHQLLAREQSRLAAQSLELELQQRQGLQAQGLAGTACEQSTAVPHESVERTPSRTITARVKALVRPGSSGSCSGLVAGDRSPRASVRGLAAARVSLPDSRATQQQSACPNSAAELEKCRLQVAELQCELKAREVRAQAQQAEAATALSEARGQWGAELALVKGRMQEVEAAAEELMLHQTACPQGSSSPGWRVAASTCSADECRATRQAQHAQMWRERLARQRAEVAVLEWRLKGLEPAAPAAGNLAVGAGAINEEAMAALEMARQHKLHYRTEQLERQLAQYNTLLAAAEGLSEVPCLGGGARSNSRQAGRHPSPAKGALLIRPALAVLQTRKAQEEAAALREQLQTVLAEVASVRRPANAAATARQEGPRRQRCQGSCRQHDGARQLQQHAA
ncbi:hypothetical protein D9Q98_001799 [Chlorella vulgaris]|uniref:Centrosomal protein of 162 kDa n=1 Tax=Chlorella vulgaris TaxID=3077 RepID=A0A9D4TVF9_CHLVU|nr:hypothetical protein D9Q98_001799 [Chlorella vulgaris]